MKKILSVVLTISMLLGMLAIFPGAAHAAFVDIGSVEDDYAPIGEPISSVEEFINMDPYGTYYLTNDIDFGGDIYEGCVVPTQHFEGLVDGCGYALLGITIESSGDAGIFDLWFRGTLMNISLGTEEAPVTITATNGDASVGVVAGTAEDCTFDNVKIYAHVDAQGKTAGFTAYMNSNTIIINNCAVYGSIKGGATAGFVVTSSGHTHTTTIEITNSVNYADISSYTVAPVGGFYTRDVDSGENRTTYLSITGCVNYGNITANDWRVGGIVGEYSGKAESTLLVDHCYNVGPVRMINEGGFAGGLVGGMANNNDPSGTRILTNSYNVGAVTHDVRDDRAFALAYSEKRNENVIVENCVGLIDYMTSDLLEENCLLASGEDEILPFLTDCEHGDLDVTFIEDADKINNGYPLLSWQVTKAPSIPAFDAGTIAPGTDTDSYTIGTKSVAAFVTARDADAADTSDLRFVLAADLDTLVTYGKFYMTIAFKDASGKVVKSITKNVVDDLDYYASAVAAGDTYVAADGCAIFGIVITDVPNNAWASVVVSIAATADGEPMMAGVSTTDILG